MSLLPSIDVANLSIDHIIEAFNNTRYKKDVNVYKFARENGAFKYVGYAPLEHAHFYYIADVSELEDDEYDIHKVGIQLGWKGTIVAEYYGLINSGPKEMILKYFK